MSRAKLLVAACFVVFGMTALAASTASAGNWDVNGTPLTSGSVALASTALVLNAGILEIEATGEAITVKCEAHELLINEGKLEGPDNISAKDVTFHGCKTTGTSAAHCTVPDLILSVGVKGLATLDGTLSTLIKVEPATKTVFATIKFGSVTEGSCAIEGGNAVTGGIDLLIHEGFHSAVTHRVLAFSLPGGLKVASNPASLKELVGDLKLNSGLPWNFL
jgi:hypothetical protein